jgi:uncharacterized membrane protein YedE/YeeE
MRGGVRVGTASEAHRRPLPSVRGAREFVLYLLTGIYFGVVITKAEVVSWFRIQEMFRFQSFHMYGIIGSAVLVGAVSVSLIRKAGLRSLFGEEISIAPKTLGRGVRYLAGGTVFGVGWAMTGACPGPLIALVGNGVFVMAVALLSAAFGTWVYGYLRPRLPH